jgi:hypothetical protein
VLGGDEVGEMHRHRVVIVRDQYAACARRGSQYFRVWQPTDLGFVGGPECHGRLASLQGLNDGVIEVGVGLKLNLHC